MSMRATLPLSQQYQLFDLSLEERLNTLLPGMMEETGFDMWIILCREYNEDPVYRTMIPRLCLTARRLSCLVFVRAEGGVERYCIAKPDQRLQRLYRNLWDDHSITQFERLRQLVDEKNPGKIGIDVSDVCGMCDGLSKDLYDQLCAALSPEQAQRLCSAYPLATRWLETRTPTELARFKSIYALAVDIMEEAYSSAVIQPGVTTTQEVEQWVLNEVNRLGLTVWFAPDVDIQRQGVEGMLSGVILPGDLLHYDMGIVYMGLCTDNQRLAYVLRPGETDAPAGIYQGLRNSNRFQDIVAEEHIAGRTGNEILAICRRRAVDAGLVPSLYCHPVGFYGHAAGTVVGLYDHQEGVEGRGEYPLRPNTCYALELNTRCAVPEWGGQEAAFLLEETVAFLRDGELCYMDPIGRKKLYLIG